MLVAYESQHTHHAKGLRLDRDGLTGIRRDEQGKRDFVPYLVRCHQGVNMSGGREPGPFLGTGLRMVTVEVAPQHAPQSHPMG